MVGPVITTAAEFYAVPAASLEEPHEARLETTALYYDPFWAVLWGVDRSGPVFYHLESSTPLLRSGQRFQFTGRVVPGRGLPLGTGEIVILPDGPPVQPIPAAGRFGEAHALNNQLVTVEGYANAQTEADANHLLVDVVVEDQIVAVRVLLPGNSPIPQIAGALVRLTGVFVSDATTALTHPALWVPGPDNITITGWLDRDPRFATPVCAVDRLLGAEPGKWVRVVGRVESQQAGEKILLRDGTGQVTVRSAMTQPVKPGQLVEAIGLPAVDGVAAILRQGLFRLSTSTPPAASPSRGLPLLRLAEQVRRLSTEDAARGAAVRLHSVVAWSSPDSRLVFVLDASGGVAVQLPPALNPPPGIRATVDVVGRSMAGDFAPGVVAETIAVVGDQPLPAPRSITLEQAITGVEESQWISLNGYVRSSQPAASSSRLELTTSAGDFVAVLPRSAPSGSLAGAVVQLRGICRATTDGDRQLTGIELWVGNIGDIRIEEPRTDDPFDRRRRSIASLRRFNSLDAFNHRVRVSGTVLDHEPGTYLNLQDGDQSLLVLSRDTAPLQPGDRVEVVGFPGRQGQRVVLRESVYRRVGTAVEPPPFPLANPEVFQAGLDGRLVRFAATVADVSQRADDVRIIGQTHGLLVEAVMRGTVASLPSRLAPGCAVSLTGVYRAQFDENAHTRGFQLRLRSARDLAVLRAAPWWNAGRTRSVAGGLTFLVLLGLAWVVALRRRVQHQTARIREQLANTARLEAELLRAAKLESLGVLAGGIAHDFNNLLTVIVGNLSLVLSGRRLPADDEECLREGERAAFRARDLTQQLLTFAKGGAPVRSAVLLPDIVRESAGFALRGSNVRCDLDFAPGLWAADVDRGQINQVVHNIALNAMQAMPDGGVLSFALRNEVLPAEAGSRRPAGRFLRLTIRDSGTGISPEHLARIFDPYFTTKKQGSGLGLATVYSIVTKHAGHIEVESQLGAGTTFTLWLPAANDTPAAAPAAAGAIPHLMGRALIMDDEPAVREMAAAMLRRTGLEVTTVANGRELLREFAAGHADGYAYDVIIADLTVPGGMGGREAVAELRRTDTAVRVIVSSGYSNDPVMADFREHGFDGRVAKPYEFEPFVHAVAAVLNSPATRP